ncbi:hypothetical protein MERGE_002680 [Pneumocystis wakefieldiae]|uniref:Glutamate--cysteine ligase n=1 Tax=Pneumocystis wakefieldiae TaxID=38082 RepID=A0A899FN03_9ASCO|nr:hypothetical protein MERGE_002680 [Pneumocystis wakefieldiae]
MGLLISGTSLSWEETQQQADYVREQGIEQFLYIWKEAKKRKKKQLLWGDEIEYMLVSYDDKNKVASLSLQQDRILKNIDNYKHNNRGCKIPNDRKTKYEGFPSFHSEYASYMIEGIPGIPYGEEIEALLGIEENMRNRRHIIKKYIKPNEVILTLTSFPRLGAPGIFTDPYYPPRGNISCSLFLPDEIISPHIRFPTLTKNIRLRRGRKVVINVPIFIDENTPIPFMDEAVSPLNTTSSSESTESLHKIIKPDHIYMDSMCFGMGCCCLQVTFQTTDILQAKNLYDQLIPMGPIMLSLTAASPAYKGYLSDQDCRWNVISRCVDDRTPEEMGEEPLKNHKFVISKSRYDSVDCYISNDKKNHPKYNDVKLIVDEEIREKLLNNGVDELLANHISHLFIRDPLVIFSNLLIQNKNESGHFENIQSTNWQALRFKPPPPGTNIGWRVEFRTMEIQLSDFENAAYCIFINLLTRIISFYDLNFYIPISKVDENMNTAHHRSSVLTEKFWFRKNIFSADSCSVKQKSSLKKKPNKTLKRISMLQINDESDEYEKMSIHEIINGQCDIDNGFPGLIPLIEDYFDCIDLSDNIRQILEKYLELIKKRASGEWQTTASWIRSFVRNHPAYKKDSVISQEINYDLIKQAEKISNEFGNNQKLTNYFLGVT